MKYEFHVGDYVENKDGEVGYIKRVCHCENCKMRGFYEPYICYKDGTDDYITFSQKDNIDSYFNRIGRYDFTKPEQPEEIKRLIKSWIIDDGEDKGEYYFDAREVIDKINELVDVVNELRNDYNKHLEAHRQTER